MIVDYRRYIVTEQMHQQGVELWCMDCPRDSPNHEALVAFWDLNAGPLDEIIQAAQAHEEKVH